MTNFGELKKAKEYLIAQARATYGPLYPTGTFDIVTSHEYHAASIVSSKLGTAAQVIVYPDGKQDLWVLVKKGKPARNVMEAMEELLENLQQSLGVGIKDMMQDREYDDNNVRESLLQDELLISNELMGY